MQGTTRVALVGPGRAGTAITRALRDAGWQVSGVAGRTPDALSTRRAATLFDAPARPVEQVAEGAAVVLLATPDGAIPEAAAAAAPGVAPGALVVHLAGSRGLEVFDALRAARPDVRTGAVHPLQTLAGTPTDTERLAGAWFAVADDGRPGMPQPVDLVEAVGGVPFTVSDRARYHAAAAVASNHLVALVAQVERLAALAGVPPEAFGPLLRTSIDNAVEHGAAVALTGPVARGDVATVARHLDAIPEAERAAYAALAREALALSGRTDPEMAALLDRAATPRPESEPGRVA